MPQVAILKCKSIETIPQALRECIKDLTDSIRKRAFSIFQNRDGRNASDVDDWLQAERDMVWSPPFDLTDDEKQFRARVALAGLHPRDIQVSAMPDALVIRTETAHTHEGESETVCYCEFSGKKLFRRLQLSGSIDVEKVKASLDKGILQVIAPKATPKHMAVSA